MLLQKDQVTALAEAIREAERHTDGELVTVLARRSDSYLYIPVLWAALAALCVPLVTLFVSAWFTAADTVVLQWLVFLVLVLVLRAPPLLPRIIPPAVRAWRCGNMARRQFLEQGLHHTADGMGVLVFVSELEHHVEILADRGVAAKVPQERWQEIIDACTAAVRQGDVLGGFSGCVEACGAVLREVAPATGEKNELPNHLVVID